ncbi:hypothetical protein F5879DRAFT_985313 [Lentinula edodes]|uniref:uncharacterized protein n=1 Tax=Lentinula edodes TaxID=5353 RepID=UPI001E8DF047|nr:uncharacterized protein C8R40DRAFT_1168962 [Lentinula edodes]KAH7877035.1 hypothetical protein C8R40DRAFT_1168962 [Lentinula edodes]KAJ3872951.1 hypothetical protein F5051DRAFT_444697 [Lentinula edodes]KAJ3908734.1 hypothetical protein F5879DRAFT_985313 [Lentinula edodes]KAJ3923429.1 hypothetical protein F5877DRAFT_74295 [Lentinula edodes]
MEPYDTSEEETQTSTPSQLTWWRRQTYEYYRYSTDDDGIVQKVFNNPDPEESNTRGRTKTPPPKGALKHGSATSSPGSVKDAEPRGATPVSFKSSTRPPKYFLEGEKRTNSLASDAHGPTKLETARFRSHDSEGETAWYFSQSPFDLDAPLPETPIPRMLATIYIHRNMKDGAYQIWLWCDRDGGGLGWQPVDLENERVAHPKIAERALKLTTSGKPSWVLTSTLTTYRSRKPRRSRSRSVAASMGSGSISTEN